MLPSLQGLLTVYLRISDKCTSLVGIEAQSILIVLSSVFEKSHFKIRSHGDVPEFEL